MLLLAYSQTGRARRLFAQDLPDLADRPRRQEPSVEPGRIVLQSSPPQAPLPIRFKRIARGSLLYDIQRGLRLDACWPGKQP